MARKQSIQNNTEAEAIVDAIADAKLDKLYTLLEQIEQNTRPPFCKRGK